MKLVTVLLPEAYLEGLDELVWGRICIRAEARR